MNMKPVTTQYLVVQLTMQHRKVSEVARMVGMTRQAIHKRLKAAGVDLHAARWVHLECTFCGKPVDKRWRLWANNKNGKNFCGPECYYASRENPGYKPWRQGQRIARAIVAQRFKLDRDHVVDHIDGDNYNNDIKNLRVFASQSDHIKMHHGRAIEPLWDGRTA